MGAAWGGWRRRWRPLRSFPPRLRVCADVPVPAAVHGGRLRARRLPCPRTLTIVDERTGRDDRGSGRGRSDPGDGAEAARPGELRPRVPQHRVRAERDHGDRRRRRHPPVPRLPDRAARGARLVPRDGVPARARGVAREGRAGGVERRDHPAHVPARERQAADGGVPLRRTPDGDAREHARRALDVLSGGLASG